MTRFSGLILMAALVPGVVPWLPAQSESNETGVTPQQGTTVRVPAEWELHEATWMQWPRWYESSYRPAFAEIIRNLQEFEPVRIIANSPSERNAAENYLIARNVPLNNVMFYVMRLDSAWMRDNGPVWVEANGIVVSEDWGFDGWGGLTNFYAFDDAIPAQVAALEGIQSYDVNRFIHERGNLEFNGLDTVILSWPCISDRNPQHSRPFLTAVLKKAFGVSRVVWLESAPSDDVTGGHVDGIARFIDAQTVVVPEYWDLNHQDAHVYEEAAGIIANAGFQVLRMPVPGEINYRFVDMPANYVNWLVANGVVVMPGFDNNGPWDTAAKQAVQSYFPNHDIRVVDTRELWYWGGSVHCVTNDQPAQQ